PLPTLAAGSTPTRVATLVAAGPTQAVADLAFTEELSPVAPTAVAMTSAKIVHLPTAVVAPTEAQVTLPEPTVPAVEPTLTASLPTETAPTVVEPSGIVVTLIGDSVMLGAEKALANRLGTDVHIDAVVGRRMGDLFAVADDLAARGRLASTVVVHLGSNQPYEGAVLDAVMERLLGHGVQRVIFVNVRRPARWVEGINWRMAEGVARYPQAQLIDWFGLSNANDGWFIPDGTHLTGTGIGWYVDAIAQALGR
ncbi:MAG TPA: hypothetical protein PK954_13080, partial [Anaerolineales bacterium]|nr:hypothetical protein [Anaerolineales bacterium]